MLSLVCELQEVVFFNWVTIILTAQAPRLAALRLKRSGQHLAVTKMTLQTSARACIQLYALQVSIACM